MLTGGAITENNEALEAFLDTIGHFGAVLDVNEISKFLKYKDLLISWNKKVNLTSITEEKDIFLRHFADSLSILPFIEENDNVIDVGTGAGFPGLPVKIAKPGVTLTLLDSLSKRTAFLLEAADMLCLSGVNVIHGRAETLGRADGHREMYDISVSRAVAPLNILAELCMPFVRIGGFFLAMKGGDADSEINKAKSAVIELGGEISCVSSFSISADGDNLRTVIKISKTKATPQRYPRRDGIPAKRPL